MSPPINPESTHRRVLAVLDDQPRTMPEIARQLGVENRAVSRAIWHLRRTGKAEVYSAGRNRRYLYHYVACDAEPKRAEPSTPFVCEALLAMQDTARKLQSLRTP